MRSIETCFAERNYRLVLLCLVFTSCFLFSKKSNAQSLNFNQVLRVSSVEDTVPSGKVWKIVQYSQANTATTNNLQSSGCSVPSYHHPYFINNELYWNFGTVSGYNAFLVSNSFPIWLEPGARVKTSCAGDFLSIIEFNISP